MRTIIGWFTAIAFLVLSAASAETRLVSNEQALLIAIEEAKPGDRIEMSAGTWRDIEIAFTAEGASRPRSH